ncbi:MAG: hypothetical protein V4550_18460 [Gemmatimonadota bacterium]
MNAREAFDDVLGAESVDIIDMMGETLRVLRRRRFRVPVRVELVGFDPTAWTFEPAEHVVGAASTIIDGHYPLYDRLRKMFRSAIGRPKLVRLDGEESYAEFRDLRRQPYLADLDARLGRLERAFEGHISDHHGGHNMDVEEFERHLDGGGSDEHEQAVIGVVTEAARGGKPVDLGLPSSMRGKVECWTDGDEVLVSARTPYGIATTGAPLDDTFEEVVGCAEVVGCVGDEALLVGANLAPKVAGRKLFSEICAAAPVFAQAREPFVGLVVPQADPDMAAMMALLQRCQQGDKQACREALKLASSWRGLVKDAGVRLTSAQKRKAQVVGMDAREFGVNFFGGAHTGGNILLHAFGAGALGDQLTQLEAPALPGWAGGTADVKPGVFMPPPPAPKAPQSNIVIVASPDSVIVIHVNGTHDEYLNSSVSACGVLGGVRFDGNGYKRGAGDKFSFGYDSPAQVTLNLKTGGKKVVVKDAKLVLFQGGKEQAVSQ